MRVYHSIIIFRCGKVGIRISVPVGQNYCHRDLVRSPIRVAFGDCISNLIILCTRLVNELGGQNRDAIHGRRPQ